MARGGWLMTAALLMAAGGCAPEPERPAAREEVSFRPVRHASFVIGVPGATVYVDPVGKPEEWTGLPGPDIILITDIHGDHLAPELVKALRGETTVVIGPKAAVEKLAPPATALANGESIKAKGIDIRAVPMYNLAKERLQYHPKGRGNGYVLTAGAVRIYVSGDTEDIPEMRALRNIDYALVCMNLPYTMTPEQAASAVREMKPRVVIPYHYRGKDGMSDLEKFRSLVGPGIEVRLLKWYD